MTRMMMWRILFLKNLRNQLDKNDRTLLTFRFGRDMPLKDLAVLMEISEETAKKRSQRALKKLRKILEEFER